MKRLNLKGKHFNRLTVLGPAQSVRTATGMYTMWRCVCSCKAKSKVIVRTSHLTERRTKSCGCLFLESLSKNPRGRKPNGTAYLRYVFGYYLKNATLRGMPFELDFDQFCGIITQRCYYCGAPPSQGKNKSRLDRPTVFNGVIKHNGIDRINNALGYIQQNVRPCCKHCNRAKRDRTEKAFRQWVLAVAAHWATLR